MGVRIFATSGAVLAAALSIGLPLASQAPSGTHGSGPGGLYSVGLFGDMPYGADGRVEYPRLLADMNHSGITFSAFDGDLKAGGDGACTDELYYQSRDWFNTLDKPVVVTP